MRDSAISPVTVYGLAMDGGGDPVAKHQTAARKRYDLCEEARTKGKAWHEVVIWT